MLDLLIVGTGPAASRVAEICASADWDAAICDGRPYGGTCALRGCNPKKVLVRQAQLVDWARRVQGKAFAGEPPTLDWPRAMAFKRTFTDSVPEYKEQQYRDLGLQCLHGAAQFAGPQELVVGDRAVRARRIVIASGARPVSLGIPGEELLTTSDDFLELDSLPEHIVFVGGGYVSFEFAHIVARAGVRVTVLERQSRPLRRFDADLVDLLLERTRGLGIEVRTNTDVCEIRRENGRLVVEARCEDGQGQFEAGLVVHGAGRMPNLDQLDLAVGEVEAGDKGVLVDEFLRSASNPHVYAAGDAADTGAPALTPAANTEGRALGHNLLNPDDVRSPDCRGIGTAVFTIPELAAVGMGEKEAEEAGLDFEVRRTDLTEKNSVRKIGESCAAAKVLIEPRTERVLGAHLVGPGAAESINVFGLAIRHDIPAFELAGMPFAFPTFINDIHSML